MGGSRARRGKRGAKRVADPAVVAPPPGLEAGRIQVGEQELATLTFPLGTPEIPSTFSPAEREVALALLVGQSNASIAAARNTSVRTVANQIGAMFRKLGVHSRPEFVVALGTLAGRAPRGRRGG